MRPSIGFRRVVRANHRAQMDGLANIAPLSDDTTEGVSLFSTLPHHLLDKDQRIVEIASALPGEGTSTLAREIALLMGSRFSKSVMLVRVLDGPCSELGLESVVYGNIPLDCVVKTDPTLSTLATTTLCVGNPTIRQLFDERQLNLLFAQMVKLARLVILDTPPILSSVTAAVLAPKTSGVLLVIRAGKTRAITVERALRVIERGGGRILGVVLNRGKAGRGSEVDAR